MFDCNAEPEVVVIGLLHRPTDVGVSWTVFSELAFKVLLVFSLYVAPHVQL